MKLLIKKIRWAILSKKENFQTRKINRKKERNIMAKVPIKKTAIIIMYAPNTKQYVKDKLMELQRKQTNPGYGWRLQLFCNN